MADTPETPASPPPPERIELLPIEQEMRQSYLTYAMSVIVSRALPDVRDGLKPSQRRILVAMNDLNLGPNAKYRKCAKIAGDTSGNYHPHGEAVIYPTLVRMAQPFNMRYPLIDGQGNFGSVDADPPAAMRYTEARMTEAAVRILEGLDEGTVDFIPNYDETREEPVVLPGGFPTLLCNGASGIAVGMATSIPPHNFTEVAAAIMKLIDEPDTDVDGLMKIIPGPDFPTGAFICGRKGILSAYRTGRGTITLRARTEVEERKGGRVAIIVTEIPYQCSKARIIEQIAALVKDGAVTTISDVRDESDRRGMRIVIELKRGEEEQLTLNQLFERTDLQTTFSMILLALVDGRPRTLDLKEIVQCFIDHRAEVVRRRTRYRLRKAEERAHILEGLRIAIANIDEIVEIIKTSSSPDGARKRLTDRFELSEVQADAILKMQLQRLTGLEVEKLEVEYADLQERIAEYKAILGSHGRVLAIVREEIEGLGKKFTAKRRTEITGAVEAFTAEDLIADEEMAVTVSHNGYAKRMPLSAYRTQGRGGRGVTGISMQEGDFVEHLFIASAHEYILFFTNRGKVYWQKVYDLPQLARTAKGRSLVTMLGLAEGETISAALGVRGFEEGSLLMATARGKFKRTELSAFGRPKRGGIIAINLADDDELIGVRPVRAGEQVVAATRQGYALRCEVDDIRPMGRTAAGVKGVGLRKDDAVVSLMSVEPEIHLLTVSEKGYGKRTPVDDYRITRRGGKGVVNFKTAGKTGPVVVVRAVFEVDEVIVMTAHGIAIRTKVADIRATGRAASGVRVARVDGDDHVVTVAHVAESD